MCVTSRVKPRKSRTVDPMKNFLWLELGESQTAVLTCVCRVTVVWSSKILVPHYTLTPILPLILSMSDQEGLQDNQAEQQHDRQVVPPPWVQVKLPPLARAMFHVIAILMHLTYKVMMDHIIVLYFHTLYHTSALSKEGWVQELLTRHPERIWNELGIYWNTFLVLIKAVKLSGHKSSCHVSIEEQVSIFLYTIVTGLGCTHIGEHF